MSTADSRSLQELINALAAAQPDNVRGEPSLSRQKLYHNLAAHDDPMVREIGEQLRDGTIRPYELLSIPGYREVVGEGVHRLKQLNEQMDMEAVRSELEWRVAKAERQQRGDQ